MKNNNTNGNQEFEKLLKDKMNELSTSVDCFEKISARAFPEKDSDFSDSEFTVSYLENVTGKRRGTSILKWGAIAAAAVLFVGILPKTAFFNNLFADLGKDSNKVYRSIISEINSETEEHEYRTYDLSLEEYIVGDVLITPMYCCPFEECGKDNINVRIFIRTVDTSLTNQIYAVEYTGTYTESNFIAVAESKAKFTDEEIAALSRYSTEWQNISTAERAAEYNFTADKYGNMTDNEGNIISAASFEYQCFFKDESDVYPLVSNILYYQTGVHSADRYYYDIDSYILTENGTESFELPDPMSSWKTSVYYDGTSALPDEIASDFTKVQLFSSFEENESYELAFIQPFFNEDSPSYVQEDGISSVELHQYESSDRGIISTIETPFDTAERAQMKIYIAHMNFMFFSSYSDPYIKVKSDSQLYKEKYSQYDLTPMYDYLTSEKKAGAENTVEAERYPNEQETASTAEQIRQAQEESIKRYDLERELSAQ